MTDVANDAELILDEAPIASSTTSVVPLGDWDSAAIPVIFTLGSATQLELIPQFTTDDGANWRPISDTRGATINWIFTADFAGVVYFGGDGNNIRMSPVPLAGHDVRLTVTLTGSSTGTSLVVGWWGYTPGLVRI